MPSQTRRRKQKGGATVSAEDKARISHTANRIRKTENQIIHTLSQLHRFTQCFKAGDMSRGYQFAYNLGRLQELVAETTHPDVWWKPVETCLTEHKWDELEDYIEQLRQALGVEFDEETLTKGC